jgi:hypothetical protein
MKLKTRRVHFRFPNFCARCASRPAEAETTVFGPSQQEWGGSITTYEAEVPVCRECQCQVDTRMSLISSVLSLLWLIGELGILGHL